MIARLLQALKGNELDRVLKKAAKEGKRSFLIPWNRGLGDIALGLYALVFRIRSVIPEARITFMTRKDLEDAFRLLEGAEVIGIPWWQRGTPFDLDGTLGRMRVDRREYDVVIEKANPTKWLSWQIGTLTPKLLWKSEYDERWKRFALHDPSKTYIGIHLNTETGQFYGYSKDWPDEKWETLLEVLSERPDTKIVLFGVRKTHPFRSPAVLDLRGETNLLEMLSILKNRCSFLIAPDGGVLSLSYYLDTFFPLTIISLWGDSRQGVLKQAVPSPNSGLVHFPLIGEGKDITAIRVGDVVQKIVLREDSGKSARAARA